jgi:hypothetical protein
MTSSFLLICARLLVSLLPVIAALWGMTLVAYGYEWAHYRMIVRGAHALVAPYASSWIVVERRGEEYVRHIRCQEIVVRLYRSW